MAEIQNPNQGGSSGGGMGGDSKSLFGFMIVFVLMVVAFQVFGPKKTQQPTPAQQKTQTATSSAVAPPAATTNAESPAAPTEVTRPGKAAAARPRIQFRLPVKAKRSSRTSCIASPSRIAAPR